MKSTLQPDLDRIIERFEAFWDCKIIDRPMYSIIVPKPKEEQIPIKYPDYKGDWEARWLDVSFRVKEDATRLQNMQFFGDAIPFVCPGMGTDILAAATGCGYRFDGITGWSSHDLTEWSKESEFLFDDTNKYYIAQMEYVKGLIEFGRDTFVVGHPDYHPTGDQLAAMRGTEQALMDLIEHPDHVKAFLRRTQSDFYAMYDQVESWLQEADMPSMSWSNLAAKRSHWMICNDFSIMISPSMFDEFFLPYVVEEATRFHRTMYHLDGAGALHHLDSILSIKELNGVQFLPGAGSGALSTYLPIFQQIQNAGKCLEILYPTVDDLPILMEGLRPEGVIFNWIQGVTDKEHAREIENAFQSWGMQYGYGK